MHAEYSHKRRNATAGASLALVMALGSLSGAASAATVPPLSRNALANAAYVLPDLGAPVQLKDGVYEDTANRIRVTLGAQRGAGDLDRDGVTDAAVVLNLNTGGTGTFALLYAVLNDAGTAKPIAHAFLGDRVTVRSVRITSRGELLATYLDRRPGQPMVARPTVTINTRYRLSDGKLVATAPVSERSLAYTTYPLKGAPNDEAPLVNGVFEDLQANMKITLQRRPRATGDLDGDGDPDTAVLLSETTAGSGSFSWVAAVLNDRYAAAPAPAQFIGDRVVVQSLAIRDGVLTVRYLDRRPGQPLSSRPTVPQTRRLLVSDGALRDADSPPPSEVPPATAPITPTTPITPTAAVTPTPAAGGDLLSVLAADKRFSALVAAVSAAGLTPTLSGPGPFTVFAPTDDAFAALDSATLAAMLKNDTGQVRDILLYHVLPGNAVTAKMITPALRSAGTALPRAAVNIQASDGTVTLDGRARVTQADLTATNGVIHAIDAVLLPPMSAGARLALDGRFKMLITAVKSANLAEALDMQLADITLFAPTDAAFGALPAKALSDTLSSKQALTGLLLNHIVSPTLKAADVAKASALTTLSGGVLPVTADGAKVTVQGAAVIEADIALVNGVMHVVDGVLAPAAPATTTAPIGSGVLTGTVTYRQRIALPPNAVIEVQLADVSRADAAATILASQTITAEGKQVPFAFALKYDPAQIDSRLTYAVAARISVDGRLRWVNATRIPVLTRNAPLTGIDVLVSPTP